MGRKSSLVCVCGVYKYSSNLKFLKQIYLYYDRKE